MIRLLILLVLGSFFSPAPLLAVEQIPADVRQFIAQRESCDHFRGEIPESSSKQHMKDVSREIRRLCTGTDRKLARLKQKYSASPALALRLNEFESAIEAEPTVKPRPPK